MEIKDQFKETRLFVSRTVIAVAMVFIFLFGILLYRMFYLQVIKHEEFSTKSKDNRIKVLPLPPRRGLIYDRNKNILADNIPSFQIKAIPEEIKDPEKTINELSEIIAIDQEKIPKIIEEIKLKKRNRLKRHQDLPIKTRLDSSERDNFAVYRHKFPGIDIKADTSRRYPLKNIASHVVGYVGRIDEKELQNLNGAEYAGSTHIGKNGIEKHYEKTLLGEVGSETIEVNNVGRRIRSLSKEPPLPGKDLVLTIDIELQKEAEAALEGYAGAIVAVDTRTGEILALASVPTFDLNLFPNGISHKDYSALLNNKYKPLVNKFIRGQYPPGSTVKPAIGLAGLYNNIVTADKETYCPGFYQLPRVSHKYRDWKRWGHGKTNIKKAIAESCDVYFYDLAYNMGVDKTAEFLDRFGFGKKIMIDLPGEKSGVLPNKAWKKKVWNTPKLRKRYRGRVDSPTWYHGETLIAGIGQGFFLATPLQLAYSTAIIANKGKPVPLHLLKEIIDPVSGKKEVPMFRAPTEPITDVRASDWEVIHQGMREVVHGRRGTARKVGKDAQYEFAGKTGTAQVSSIKQNEEAKDCADIPEKLRDHALFIAFAPFKKPEIAVAVIAEHGCGGSSVAAPIARRVLDKYFKIEPPPAEEEDKR